MHVRAISSAQPRPADPKTLKGFVLRLAPLLMRHDLTVTVDGHGVVEVRNPAGEPEPGRPGQRLGPGMRQQVTLRSYDGDLWWEWVWAGPTRDAPPELEPMTPAYEVEEAARRIANVLRVRDPERAES